MEEKVSLAKSYKSLLERLAQDLQNLYAEGMTTKNEVLKVQVKQNEVELSLMQAENGLVLSKMLLGQIIGVDAEQITLDKSVISEEELSSRLVALTDPYAVERAEVAVSYTHLDELKLVEKPKKTKTGQYVTREEELQKLAHLHPIIGLILRYRGLRKLVSTYIEPLPQPVS